MTEYIERAAAVRAIWKKADPEDDWVDCPAWELEDNIKSVPVADVVEWSERTINGYPIKEVFMFARACRAYGITPDKMHEYYKNCEIAAALIKRDMEESVRKAWEMSLSPDGWMPEYETAKANETGPTFRGGNIPSDERCIYRVIRQTKKEEGSDKQ